MLIPVITCSLLYISSLFSLLVDFWEHCEAVCPLIRRWSLSWPKFLLDNLFFWFHFDFWIGYGTRVATAKHGGYRWFRSESQEFSIQWHSWLLLCVELILHQSCLVWAPLWLNILQHLTPYSSRCFNPKSCQKCLQTKSVWSTNKGLGTL